MTPSVSRRLGTSWTWLPIPGWPRPETVELVSPLQCEECCRLLAAQVDSPWERFARRPLVGRVSGETLRIGKRTFGSRLLAMNIGMLD